MLEQFINLITLIGFKRSSDNEYIFVERSINNITLFAGQDFWEIRINSQTMKCGVMLNYKREYTLDINNDSITFIKDKFSHIIIENRDKKLNKLI